MDFSERASPVYVTLGNGPACRRRAAPDERPLSPVERFLGDRFHGFTTVVSIERGSGVVSGAFGDVPVGAGDVVLLPPGLIRYAFGGARRVHVVALPRQVAAGAIVRAAELPRGLFSRDDQPLLDGLMRAPTRRTFVRTEIERTAMRALATVACDPGRARLMRVAHELGYTSDGLSALLRRSTGRNFARWRDALLMANVRAMLSTGSPVTEIARAFAVESPYVHRRFARAHGTTPHRWRRMPDLPPHAPAHDWDMLQRFFAVPVR